MIISVLVKADKHANDFQMFLSIFKKSCKTGENRGQLGLENGKHAGKNLIESPAKSQAYPQKIK